MKCSRCPRAFGPFVYFLLYHSLSGFGYSSIPHAKRDNRSPVVHIGFLIWFPALFLIAWNGLEINPSRGTLPSVLSLWFGQSLIWLWLTPMALGAAYYLIPTILGRPIDKYYLAIFGFGALLPWLRGPWSIIWRGAVPMWIPAIGTVMSIAMIFPIAVASTNFHATAFQDISKVWNVLPLRFVIFGTISYTLSSYIGVIFSLPDVPKSPNFQSSTSFTSTSVYTVSSV